MKRITTLLYIFILTFTSCEEEVDYDDLGVKNIIVVNGKFAEGETPWCQVSRSDIIFEQTQNKIMPAVFLPNATVTASEGNSDYKYVIVGDSAVMEAKGLKVEAGETYTLKAKANGFDNVYSTVTIPSKPKAEIRLVGNPELDMSVGNFKRYKVTYELNIQDDPKTEDYYQILFYVNCDFSGIDYLFYTNDPVMKWDKNESENNLFETNEKNETNIFNDQLFNGQTSKIRFYRYTYDNTSGNPVYYELRHITKETYMYYRTIQLVRDNDLTGSLSPYILYCNVENGAGLVAAWSSVKKELDD